MCAQVAEGTDRMSYMEEQEVVYKVKVKTGGRKKKSQTKKLKLKLSSLGRGISEARRSLVRRRSDVSHLLLL
jgi:hypothetical protein